MNKKRITGVISIVLVYLMGIGTLSGCGNGKETTTSIFEEKPVKADTIAKPEDNSLEADNTDKEPSETEDEGGVVGVSDSWVNITEDEADDLVGRLFTAPEGAEVLDWMKCEELGDPDVFRSPLVQLSFVLDGITFTARAQQGTTEDEDITGLYVDWDDGPRDVTLANWGGGNMKGKTFRSVNETGYLDLITWYDIEIGISYALFCAAEDLDGFDIQAIAEQMYTEDNESYVNVVDVPEETETADGFYGAYLLASDRDKIGTRNEFDVLYAITHQGFFYEDKLYIVGSMNYRNFRDQDPIFVSEDLCHVFSINEDTICELSGGDADPEIISSEDFEKKMIKFRDSGLYLEIEIKDGVVKTASISI